MSAGMNMKKQCITCNKSGGILICDGCQQPFCGKHVIEHRQQLAGQLDGIMQEHDLLQQELGRSSNEHILLQNINKWEQESVTKIQVAAETARADLREMIDKLKDQWLKACHDIAMNLRSSREADDFSENDLTQWMKQLNELKLEITSPSSVKLVEDKHSSISFITIKHDDATNDKHAKSNKPSFLKHPTISFIQEKFSNVFGAGILDEESFLAKHVGRGSSDVHFLGQHLYSQGRQTVRFKIEQSGIPYDMFFGCISSRVDNSKITYNSPFSVGWFGFNQIFQHQDLLKDHDYESIKIVMHDILCLTFDCEKRQIELFHESTNKTYTLAVSIDKSPFPWRLLLALCHPDDCVRILCN